MSSFLKIPGSRIMAAALLLAILTIIVPAVPASAVPPAPHQFYGNVFVGGVAPSSGTIIAKINGVQYATGTIDSQGRYGYSAPLFRVPADNPDTADKEGGVLGDTVQFFVGGTQAYQTYAFQSGGSTNLDLTVPGTATPPAVTTVAAGNIASTTVTLNGNLTATGSQVPLNVYFRYGTTTGYGMSTAPVSTSSTGQFAAYVSGLTPNITYNFIAVAEGSSTVPGTNLTFTTLASSVTVSTVAATNVGTNAATLNGNLTSLGGTGAVEVYFQYGTNGTTWPYTTPRQGMSAIGTFSYPINALSYNTKYYFQAVAVFGGNSVTGSILNFTTLPQGGSTAVNRFYGTVYVNGLATSSATVVAYLNGAATTPASTTSSAAQGQYGYSPLFNVYGGPGTVTFRVNNVLVPQTATWTSGGVTQLDLYATPGVLTAATGSGTYVSSTTATLGGTLVSLGILDTSATPSIDYGPTMAYEWGTWTMSSMSIPGTFTTPAIGTGPSSPPAGGLTPGQVVHFKAKAVGDSSHTTASGLDAIYIHAPPNVPTIGLSATSFAFTAVSPSSSPVPSSSTLTISNAGSGTLIWTATKTASWLTIGSTGGTAPSTMTISVSPSGLADNTTYTDTITIVASGASNTPQTVTVTLRIGTFPSGCLGSIDGTAGGAVGQNMWWLCRFQASCNTTVSTVNINAATPGNIKVAIYNDYGSSIGNLLSANNTAQAVSAAGPASLSLSTATDITSGKWYWLSFTADANMVGAAAGTGTCIYTPAPSFSSFTFPPSGPGFGNYVYSRVLVAGSN